MGNDRGDIHIWVESPEEAREIQYKFSELRGKMHCETNRELLLRLIAIAENALGEAKS